MPRKKREADETVEALEAPKPKRGGRKPALDAGQKTKADARAEASEVPKPKRRRRKPDVDAKEEERAGATAEAPEAPKPKRGRRKPAVDAGEEETAHGTAEALEAPKPKRGRRRPAADAGQVVAAASRPEGVVQHYLLKSEPHEFSIEDLEAAQGSTEPWDGVRNHQARNVMRGMRTGDLCFFYHSNCKEPGIVGIAEVVREAYPDNTALDADSKKHDPKSTPKDPRWYMVDVKLVRKLARLVSLRELKEHGGGKLQGMALLTHGRLSVQPVSPQHWEFVLSLEREEAP